ncbi:hypothetical protein J3R30DRAFT_569368 [Lentinula aciculospora]|uniref:Phospholipid/glycerol acyltransferase domain-containing protein n=1 Tax=Lentinula aciculospora TaxID=153920 RepID=A0A9W9A6F7_9AGAR|nr:hypothetical protein J3R30DRAFT_569368 [Lentinula aciculospora]
MELQLVYRVLRKISDWTVTGYYSDILVEGSENILNIQHGIQHGRVDGPVILCSSHHNEMIDIATLAMTMPKCRGERRHVSFWAKESMFRSVVGGWIMRSSGAIPVKRNPNKSQSGESPEKKKPASGIGHESLFTSTIHALALHKVVGVFPEGTSYTQPGIVQVMPGAARAAVEYELWRRENEGPNVVILPVGIVYTDKSCYQSRLVVQFGTPIRITDYFDELFSPSAFIPSSSFSSCPTVNNSINASSFSQEASAASYSLSETEDALATHTRAVTKAIAIRIEKSLFRLTINAPDWETLYAAGVARDIMFEDEEISLSEWVPVSQSFVDLLSSSSSTSPESVQGKRQALTRYFALLYNTGLTHAVLQGLFPVSMMAESTAASPNSTTTMAKDVRHWTNKEWKRYHTATLFEHLRYITSTLAAWKNAAHTLSILPILPVYLPAFLVSHLTVRFLATSGEEEGEAQFRSVGGGVGLGIGLAIGKMVVSRIWRKKGVEISDNIFKKVGPITEGARALFVRCIETFGTYLPRGLHNGLIRKTRDRLTSPMLDLCSSNVTGHMSNILQSQIANIMTNKILGWLIVAWCLVKWYGLCIQRAHTAYTYILAPPARRLWTHHLSVLLAPRRALSGISSSSHILEEPDVVPYLTLPPPPTNAFIRRREQAQAQSNASDLPNLNSKRRPIVTSKLLLALLCAREEARQAALDVSNRAAKLQ